jgi:hypothetical protein
LKAKSRLGFSEYADDCVNVRQNSCVVLLDFRKKTVFNNVPLLGA